MRLSGILLRFTQIHFTYRKVAHRLPEIHWACRAFFFLYLNLWRDFRIFYDFMGWFGISSDNEGLPKILRDSLGFGDRSSHATIVPSHVTTTVFVTSLFSSALLLYHHHHHHRYHHPTPLFSSPFFSSPLLSSPLPFSLSSPSSPLLSSPLFSSPLSSPLLSFSPPLLPLFSSQREFNVKSIPKCRHFVSVGWPMAF